MLTTYLRSSSYTSHSLCEHQFYLTYVLGLPSTSGKKAAKGNVVHKALETLAWYSYHGARGADSYEDETFGPLRLADITPDWCVDASYAHYKKIDPGQDWNDRVDLKDCREWTWKALTSWGGYFDPRNLDVIEAEKRFDVEINKPWARYRWDTPEGVLAGNLRIKGTVDLVVRDRHDPQVVEIIDWKTGRRADWVTNEEKDLEKLHKDPQLLLYYLAMSEAFPGSPHVQISIVFINDGGPFRVIFGPEDLGRAEDLVRDKFRAIRDAQYPRLNKTWKCRFCPHSKADGSGESPCESFAREVRRKGADRVFFENGSIKQLTSYGTGGGRDSSAD